MIVEITSNGKSENDLEVIDLMKDTIVVEIAKHVKKKYGCNWTKCVDLAMSASWWQKDYTAEELVDISIDELVADVFKQIENDSIL